MRRVDSSSQASSCYEASTSPLRLSGTSLDLGTPRFKVGLLGKVPSPPTGASVDSGRSFIVSLRIQLQPYNNSTIPFYTFFFGRINPSCSLLLSLATIPVYSSPCLHPSRFRAELPTVRAVRLDLSRPTQALLKHHNKLGHNSRMSLLLPLHLPAHDMAMIEGQVC